MDLLKEMGVKFVKYDVKSIDALLKSFTPKIDLIVNCLGLGSKSVFNDPLVFPIRGVLAVLKPQPQLLNRIFENTSEDPITYVISREDKCILGGTTDHNNYSTHAGEQLVDEIIKRCVALLPELEANGPIQNQLVGTWVGLRPGRKVVRVELDVNTAQVPIVHCYGHGGSGWTTFWGCAIDVVELVNGALSTNPKKSKL